MHRHRKMYPWGRIQATVRFFGRRKMHSAGGDFKILLCTYVPYGLELQTSKAVRIPVPDRDHIMQ